MLTFDEFFKKKRIDLVALQKAEPALFSEFKTHFTQMGEKSFDHTKKYWFNKTRRSYPLAVEAKTEKVHIANPLAEQTITESLIETAAPAPSPKVGFTPRFKAGATAKPAILAVPAENIPAKEHKIEPDTPAASPKVGFTPRFKAGVTKPTIPTENPPLVDEEKPAQEKPVENNDAKPAYKPRFNMKNIPPKQPEA